MKSFQQVPATSELINFLFFHYQLNFYKACWLKQWSSHAEQETLYCLLDMW